MKLTKVIVAADEDTKLSIIISIETKNLEKYEAKDKFRSIISRIHDGLRVNYHAEEIKIK